MVYQFYIIIHILPHRKPYQINSKMTHRLDKTMDETLLSLSHGEWLISWIIHTTISAYESITPGLIPWLSGNGGFVELFSMLHWVTGGDELDAIRLLACLICDWSALFLHNNNCIYETCMSSPACVMLNLVIVNLHFNLWSNIVIYHQ